MKCEGHKGPEGRKGHVEGRAAEAVPQKSLSSLGSSGSFVRKAGDTGCRPPFMAPVSRTGRNR